MPHRHLYLRLLRASLLAAAAYDLVFAGAMVFFPELPARWLSLPLPAADFYLWTLATLLCMLAGLYLAAARDPRRYSAVIVVAILGRTTAAGFFAWGAIRQPEWQGLWLLSAWDLFFAVAHAGTWWPMRR